MVKFHDVLHGFCTWRGDRDRNHGAQNHPEFGMSGTRTPICVIP